MIDIEKLLRENQFVMIRQYEQAVIAKGQLVELITRLREAEKDAARYRFMRNSGKFLETGDKLDSIVYQAMKESGDE